MPPPITCWCCSCCQPALRCTVAHGLGLYSLIGLAFLVYHTWPAGQPAGADTLLERGQTYVSALAVSRSTLFPWVSSAIWTRKSGGTRPRCGNPPI
jgi:hypothetical protein